MGRNVRSTGSRPRLGWTRAGVIVTLACIVVLAAILIPLLSTWREETIASADQSRLRTIHTFLALSADPETGVFTTPGLLHRDPDPYIGKRLDGTGPEDVTLNTTAHLFSAMVGAGFVTTDLLISPRERNPVVVEDVDYDFSAVDPAVRQYWDPAFTADLRTGSNVSYAHMPLVGLRPKLRWRRSVESPASILLFGNRGPRGGIASPASLACDADGSWRGALVFHDGRIETVSVEVGAAIEIAGVGNPFVIGPEAGDVPLIGFTKAVTAEGVEFQHD